MEGSTKTFDETRLVSFLYDKYHLIAPLSCKLLRSSFNDHYIIQTTTKKFILRVYLNGKYYLRSSDDIQFELDLLRYLYLNGLAVIPPVVNKNNETISVINNNGENHYLALFPYAAGKPIDESLTIEQAMKLGVLLANLHLTAQSFQSDFSRGHLNAKSLIEDPLYHIEEYTNMFGLGDISFFNKCFNKLIEGLNELPKTHQGYGIIHGDPNPSNFFYSEEDGFSLFDFDHCAYGYRIHDLAVIKRSFPENVFGAVLDGYKKLRPLQAFEKNFIETYSNILLVKKFRDIFNMLEIKRASLDNMKIVALHAYNTIKEINGTPEN